MRNYIIALLTASFIALFPASAVEVGEPFNLRKGRVEQIVATDYMKADGRTDVTNAIQKLIYDNPNRTIYFPDGVYLVSRPILTPADPKRSVSLELDNYAVFKASDKWQEGNAIIKLGGSYAANDITTNGSNYGISGGIIDGSGVADGISIDGGRETRISNVSIKHTRIGIHIKKGANSGSSDSDIMNVNIVGNNKKDAIGVLVEGYDNTFTNMRIASVHVGVWLKTGGNSLRNIHPLFIFGKDQEYDSSVGFWVEGENNFMNFCYSDQFAVAFRLSERARINMTDCFCWWYSGDVPSQTAIFCEGKMNANVNAIRIGFHKDCPNVAVLLGEKGGVGVIQNLSPVNNKLSSRDISSKYIK